MRPLHLHFKLFDTYLDVCVSLWLWTSVDCLYLQLLFIKTTTCIWNCTGYVPGCKCELVAKDVRWLFIPAAATCRLSLQLGPGGRCALLLIHCWSSISLCLIAATFCIASWCLFCRVVFVAFAGRGVGWSGTPGWASLFFSQVLTIDGRWHARQEKLCCADKHKSSNFVSLETNKFAITTIYIMFVQTVIWNLLKLWHSILSLLYYSSKYRESRVSFQHCQSYVQY